jgi:hypothetical protein
MSRKTQQIQSLQRFVRSRVGEGIAIDVRRDGNSATKAFLDLSSAEVPTRKYPANAAAVVVGDDAVQWLLGRTNPVGKGLLSLLVLNVSFLGTRQFVKSMAEMLPGVQKFMEKNKIPPKGLIDITEVPLQTVVLEANIVAAAYAGREACLDFYHASSFALHHLSQGGKLHVDPVVRVTLSAPLLIALYRGMAEDKLAIPHAELDGE